MTESGHVTRGEFDTAESWSVEYCDLVYDDARKVVGVWYYCHPAIGEIRRFTFQDRVVPLYKNPINRQSSGASGRLGGCSS
jgi:hypothetical protein